MTESPKVFVSYSWTSAEHEAWVLEFAEDLCNSGIDVVLDKWDLKEGQDADKFMERMVSDDTIRKVIIVCDRQYVNKANDRKGGVGTETQIISAKVYKQQNESKFVAVSTEIGEDGKPCVPNYYASRIFIDMTDPGKTREKFEQLVRWIFDKPLFNKPSIGKAPEYIFHETSNISISSTEQRKIIDAIKSQKLNTPALIDDYLDHIHDLFEEYRIPQNEVNTETVEKSIHRYTDLRNKYIEFIHTMARFHDSPENTMSIHRFFEKIMKYMHRPDGVNSWNSYSFDNYRFFVHELYLYTISIFIENGRFISANKMMETEFYFSKQAEYGRDTMVDFTEIRQSTETLTNLSKQRGRISIKADLIINRCIELPINKVHLMQGDFILFLYSIFKNRDFWDYWWPDTLLFIENRSGPFEIFARSKSKNYFDNILILFGSDSKTTFDIFMEELTGQPDSLPRWDFHRISPIALTGYKNIATAP